MTKVGVRDGGVQIMHGLARQGDRGTYFLFPPSHHIHEMPSNIIIFTTSTHLPPVALHTTLPLHTSFLSFHSRVSRKLSYSDRPTAPAIPTNNAS